MVQSTELTFNELCAMVIVNANAASQTALAVSNGQATPFTVVEHLERALKIAHEVNVKWIVLQQSKPAEKKDGDCGCKDSEKKEEVAVTLIPAEVQKETTP